MSKITDRNIVRRIVDHDVVARLKETHLANLFRPDTRGGYVRDGAGGKFYSRVRGVNSIRENGNADGVHVGDIDVVLDLMIHDLDIVQWLVGSEVDVANVHAVGIPILTNRVDAANARIEFATGAVANITASRVGTEKIRKMRFFQPRDYIVIDYATNYASISNLAQSNASPWPGVRTQVLEVQNVEPLRAEIESFFDAGINHSQPVVSGEDGRRALSLALRTLEQIHEHTVRIGAASLIQDS